MVAKPVFRKQLFRNCKIEVNTESCTLSYNLNSEALLYLFGVKNAIFCKFLYLEFCYSRNYTCFSPAAQFRRHLGNAQTSLAFHSVCTKFAIPKWRYKAKSALKITNLHILNDLPNEWLYLLEC